MALTGSLQGKNVLITGASSGLGQHFATTLGEAGASVVLAARRDSLLQETVAALRARGVNAHAVPLDVRDPASVTAAFDAATSAAGVIDVVINNAGITATTPALDISHDEWSRILDTNLTGCFTVAQQAARRLKAAGRGGTIVNVASILGQRVAGMLSHYAAAKAGLIQLTQALALEWARYRIRVNALSPGYIETDLNRDFFQTDAGKALIQRIPQRRLGQMSDLDGPLLLLCSDASAYMTGSVLTVDGGHLVSSL
ncbi:SDR family NAD(P)-dependent oxidoreductase [Hyalangium versicolor]|uniref:SDR family NAD(P)-dependent oxidoreductase n=1 Tax=Hyalangium versicolor TaxID=2861190 RepID=UPI001CCA0921|nr:glucose 1-dehydrogenase [Hyalangium versicolor]